MTDDGLLRMLKVIKKDLKPARRQDSDTENDDDTDDDDLLAIEEAEDSDEAETGGEVADDQSEESEGIADSAGKGDSDSDSDGGMDDEAMFRMDSYLAQIFKEKRNQAGGETAHSQLVLFKLRVLSLLEIYLHENQGKFFTFIICYIFSP